MKKLTLLSLVLLMSLSISNLFAQDSNYSILIVKQTTLNKGMKLQNTYEIKHCVGNSVEVDLSKDKSGMDVNNIVDALNELYKKGWKLINVISTGSLRSDDMESNVGGSKNTVYYQYILSK